MRPLLAGLLCGLLALAACRSDVPRAADSAEDPASLSRTLSVGIVVVDGVYGTELTAPLDVFHHTTLHTKQGMSVFTVAPTHEAVRSFEGLRLVPDHAFADAPDIDVLVVPSAEHSMDKDLDDRELVAFVRDRGSKARYVLSLCDGAFVIAQAGLVGGRRCTTFPADVPRMRGRFPDAHVIHGVSFVRDGSVVTSAGGVRSYDAALYLVEVLRGAPAARAVAEGLCIRWDLASVPHISP